MIPIGRLVSDPKSRSPLTCSNLLPTLSISASHTHLVVFCMQTGTEEGEVAVHGGIERGKKETETVIGMTEGGRIETEKWIIIERTEMKKGKKRKMRQGTREGTGKCYRRHTCTCSFIQL